jgi:hydroxymethylglutaryl-CoA lyase
VLNLLLAHPDKPPIDEIAVFTAATDTFSLANTNVTVAHSLKHLAQIVREALEKGIKACGYIRVVIPVRAVERWPIRACGTTSELLDMGSYEVSLGDLIGDREPREILDMTLGMNPVKKLA